MSERKAVPKFGSFRPKNTPQPPPNEKEKSSSREKDRTSENQHRKHHRRRQRSRSIDRHDHVPTRDQPSPPRTTREKSPDIFFVDKKGDEKNIVYGSIHRYDVPAYYRVGAGHVLGAPSSLKIDREYGDDKGIVLNDWRESKFGRREKYVFSRVERERPRLLKIRPEVATQDVEDLATDFVSLNPMAGRKRKRTGTNGHDSSSSDNEDNHYRSIHGKSKTGKEPLDEALKYATESESSGSEAGVKFGDVDSARQKNAELGRRVEQHPQDIDAWLALIAHQDALLRGEDDRRRVTNAEIKSTAEIKIHMYEKALGNSTNLKDRERLLLGLMEEGSKIWETKVQSDRWEQISKDNIDSLMLWKSFLDFKQSTFTTFRYEDTRDIFINRIKILSEAARTADHHSIYSFHHQLIYVLLRLTIFMRESGYSELAVAIWQGLLEVNFWAPKRDSSEEESIRQFNGFWESEVPRIGDDDARGWRCFDESQNPPDTDAFAVEPENAPENTDIFQSWAVNERSRCNASLLPARTMDDVVEDDPFRVILFADIQEFLLFLPLDAAELHKALLDAFLIFCGLPPMSDADKESPQNQFTDVFVKDALLRCKSSWIYDSFSEMAWTETGENNISSALDTPVSNYQMSSSTLFASDVWFKSIAAWRSHYAGDHGPVSYKWVRNALKQLTQAHFREDLAEYYLAFEWRNEPDTIKKVSKNLLKQRPSSLKLYNAYASIEAMRGNREVANGVFSAALNMSKSMSESDSKDSILLWISWIWINLDGLNNSAALWQLLSIAEVSVDSFVDVSPTSLLKTKQHLSSRRDYHLSAGSIYHAMIYGECLALFEYLTSKSPSRETQSKDQGNITSAIKSYKTLSQNLDDRGLSKSPAHELVLQSAARLLYHHARTGPFRPALMREQLAHFITLFPQNTIFLSLYTWNESRLRIDNRVRNILLSTVLTPDSDTLTSRLFAIYYEMNHGTIHSARSAFEHAVSSPASKSSAGLWKFYVLYCLETEQFRSRAKDTWYRALRACPWAKELYIIGFERLGGLVSFEELQGTWRVMGEKELRVHVDLEDRLEEIAELEQRLGRQGLVRHVR